MKRIYLLPNLVTAFALACGLFVIFKVNMIEPGMGYYEVMRTSALLLLLAAFADFIDGALARALKAESEFGLLFDTLADAVSFGVAPSILILKSLSLEQGTLLSFLASMGAMMYSLCGVLRLVRFSVQAKEAKAQEDESFKKNFTGLPIPAAAAASVSANLFFLSPVFTSHMEVSLVLRSLVLTSVMILLGYLMVSRLKFPSLKTLHFRVPSFHLILVTVLLAVFFLYGILYYFAIVLAVLSWGYIALGLVLALIRRIAGKKSSTLQDFEPDEDEWD